MRPMCLHWRGERVNWEMAVTDCQCVERLWHRLASGKTDRAEQSDQQVPRTRLCLRMSGWVQASSGHDRLCSGDLSDSGTTERTMHYVYIVGAFDASACPQPLSPRGYVHASRCVPELPNQGCFEKGSSFSRTRLS